MEKQKYRACKSITISPFTYERLFRIRKKTGLDVPTIINLALDQMVADGIQNYK